MTEKLPWADVQSRIIQDVFYGHDSQRIIRATDFLLEGLLDSLAIVAMVEILSDAAKTDRVMEMATNGDFKNLETVRQLYDRL